MTQLRSGAVDKVAGIFTQRIWQPYICQHKELNSEIKKKTGGGKRVQANIWGGMAHSSPPLESPLPIIHVDQWFSTPVMKSAFGSHASFVRPSAVFQ